MSDGVVSGVIGKLIEDCLQRIRTRWAKSVLWSWKC